jgi:GNAT superfamily N-acetyltransferase
MQPTDIEVTVKVVSHAMLENPIHIAVFQGTGETERLAQEEMWRNVFTNNPQNTYLAINNGQIIGAIRSFNCSSNIRPRPPFSPTEHDYFSSKNLSDLSLDERRRWWSMIWGKHDPVSLHSHVGPFGILPGFQGRGIGSRLMKHYLTRQDKAGMPSYLETDKPINVRFYRKHGYKVIETDYCLGVEFFCLWRDSKVDS